MADTICAALMLIGFFGIFYAAYGMVKLTDYFEEVYGYDRNSYPERN